MDAHINFIHIPTLTRVPKIPNYNKHNTRRKLLYNLESG